MGGALSMSDRSRPSLSASSSPQSPLPSSLQQQSNESHSSAPDHQSKTLSGSSTAALFTPFQSGQMVLKNRIVVSPMCQYSSSDGFYNDHHHLRHLGQFAEGGVGLVITEATAVAPNGRISAQCAGLWKDDHIAAVKRIVDYVHAQNCCIGVQLAHAGRKAEFRSREEAWAKQATDTEETGVVGPSALPWARDHVTPLELSVQGIARVVQQFVDAAKRADKAGFDLIELHGAHGYLMSEFLSPLANTRTDDYGGSLANRMRFVVEVVCAVRTVWPRPKPLWVRYSCTDWVEEEKGAKGETLVGGWTQAMSVELAKVLKENGVDLIDCSSGGNSERQDRLLRKAIAPCYQTGFAAEIRAKAQLATGAVGCITTPQEADQIVMHGKADVVLLARTLLREPGWALRAAAELGVAVPQPRNPRLIYPLPQHQKRLTTDAEYAKRIRQAQTEAELLVKAL